MIGGKVGLEKKGGILEPAWQQERVRFLSPFSVSGMIKIQNKLTDQCKK
jgi:hypothetical protein